jgi:hypothetical protein
VPPLAALPLGDVGALELELDEPPDAPEAGALGEALDEELELLSLDMEPDTEPDGDAGEAGEVVEPADEEDPGARAPVLFVASRSQAVSRLAPIAIDTAAARIESLMWPPWLGYHQLQQGSGHQPLQLSLSLARPSCPHCKFFPLRSWAVTHSPAG